MPLSDTRRRLVGRLHRRRTREREGLVLVEGSRATEEALSQGARPRFVLRTPSFATMTPPGLAERLARIPDVEEIADEEMRELAGTETPQGLLLVAEEPRPRPDSIWADPGARIVILDGVQDPGNVGTLVRVAAAFGCSAVVALDGTADVWGPKALRASAGTAFRIPVVREAWSVVCDRLDAWSGMLLRADAEGEGADGVAVPAPWALALGGEGGGCRSELRVRADRTVAIPMPGGVESLNVGIAGALLLYELTRNRGTGGEPFPETRGLRIPTRTPPGDSP